MTARHGGHNKISIRALPAHYQRIVYMRDVECMIWRDIATAMGTSSLTYMQTCYQRVQIEAAREKLLDCKLLMNKSYGKLS